jgi:hypothetical protein
VIVFFVSDLISRIYILEIIDLFDVSKNLFFFYIIDFVDFVTLYKYIYYNVFVNFIRIIFIIFTNLFIYTFNKLFYIPYKLISIIINDFNIISKAFKIIDLLLRNTLYNSISSIIVFVIIFTIRIIWFLIMPILVFCYIQMHFFYLPEETTTHALEMCITILGIFLLEITIFIVYIIFILPMILGCLFILYIFLYIQEVFIFDGVLDINLF